MRLHHAGPGAQSPAAPTARCPPSIGSNAGLRELLGVVHVVELRRRELLACRRRSPPGRPWRVEREAVRVGRLLVADLVEREVERHRALADLQRAERDAARARFRLASSLRSETSRLLPRRQLRAPVLELCRARRRAAAAPRSAAASCPRVSPQVTSKSTSIVEEQQRDRAVPSTCHGVGPSSSSRAGGR